MKRAMLLLCFMGLFGLIMVHSASADEIGKLNPTGWSGTFAGAKLGVGPGPWEASDSNLGIPNAPSQIDYHPYMQNADVVSAVSPYQFNGFNSAYGGFGDMHAGGFFRDEIYFQTYNNSPGYLEFQFAISFSLGLYSYDLTSQSLFAMTLLGYTGEDVIINDPNALPFSFSLLDSFGKSMKVDADGNITLDGQIYASDDLYFNGTVTLSTNANGILLTSGSYIPLSFTLWTDTNEGYVDWINTVLLQDVKAYDEYGNLLDSTQYTLLSRNGDFFDFTNQMPSTPVPEPISMLLFGTGIVGIGGYVRKKFKQN